MSSPLEETRDRWVEERKGRNSSGCRKSEWQRRNRKILNHKTTITTVVDNTFFFFFFLTENKSGHFLWIVCQADNSHKMSTYFQRKNIKKVECCLKQILLDSLTHCCWDTPNRVFGKQCRPRSDTAECGIRSGSSLFANTSAILL